MAKNQRQINRESIRQAENHVVNARQYIEKVMVAMLGVDDGENRYNGRLLYLQQLVDILQNVEKILDGYEQ